MGSWASNPPTVTATAVCTRNARDTPIHTYSGRNRVASTSVAMKVLSGSSTRKIEPKTMAMVARSKSISRRLYPRRPQYADGVSDPQTLASAALAAAVLALVVAVVALVRLGRVRAQLRVVEGQRPVGSGDLAALRADIAQALRHVAVVRYDAFGDMGGRLSFSAAVIDDQGDGLVFSSIHARGESRTYAKGIVGGGSDATLTPEEQQALAAARTGSQGA